MNELNTHQLYKTITDENLALDIRLYASLKLQNYIKYLLKVKKEFHTHFFDDEIEILLNDQQDFESDLLESIIKSSSYQNELKILAFDCLTVKNSNLSTAKEMNLRVDINKQRIIKLN